MTVWIAQCLCPARHCVLASAGEADTEAEAQRAVRTPLRRAVLGMLTSGVLNPWCGLCDAHRATWRYELGRTAFASMKEAAPALRELEERNLATAAAWGDIHRTSKPN